MRSPQKIGLFNPNTWGAYFLNGDLFVKSYRADPGARYLAVAGAGALAAILLHSLADFNLYIPANAMLLAWIAGMTPEARPPSAILSRWEQLASGPAQRLRAA